MGTIVHRYHYLCFLQYMSQYLHYLQYAYYNIQIIYKKGNSTLYAVTKKI